MKSFWVHSILIQLKDHFSTEILIQIVFYIFHYSFLNEAVDANNKELSEEDKIYIEYYKRKQAFDKLPISKKSNLGLIIYIERLFIHLECYCGSGKKFKKCCYWRELNKGTLIGGGDEKKTQ